MAVSLNSFSPNTKIESVKVNANFTALSGAIKPTFVFTVFGTLVTGVSLTPALLGVKSLTIEKAYAYVKTPPTGASIIIDINKNDTSIWASNQANRATIVAGANLGVSSSFDTTTLVENDVLTLDIDSVGSTVSGVDLTVQLKCS